MLALGDVYETQPMITNFEELTDLTEKVIYDKTLVFLCSSVLYTRLICFYVSNLWKIRLSVNKVLFCLYK